MWSKYSYNWRWDLFYFNEETAIFFFTKTWGGKYHVFANLCSICLFSETVLLRNSPRSPCSTHWALAYWDKNLRIKERKERLGGLRKWRTRKERRKRRGFWKQHLTHSRYHFTFLHSSGCVVLGSHPKSHTSQCCQKVVKQHINSQIWIMSLLHWNLLLTKGDGRLICLCNNASLFYRNQNMCWNITNALERCLLTLKTFGSGPNVKW